jgi:hypothetical protein
MTIFTSLLFVLINFLVFKKFIMHKTKTKNHVIYVVFVLTIVLLLYFNLKNEKIILIFIFSATPIIMSLGIKFVGFMINKNKNEKLNRIYRIFSNIYIYI